METMEISVPAGMVKKEWFTTKEFAAGVHVSLHSFRRWLRRHPEFTEKFCQKTNISSQRPKYLIFWKGIAAYISLKGGTYHGNRHEKSPGPGVLQNAKSMVTHKANKMIEHEKSQLTPIQALLATVQNMAALEEKVNEQSSRLAIVEHKQVEQDQLLGRVRQFEEESEFLTSYQKSRINERIRAFVIERAKVNGVAFESFHFSRAFRKLHDAMGKRDLYEYRFEDYKKAMDILRDWYVEYGLSW